MKIYLLLSLLVVGIAIIDAKGHHANGHQHRGKEAETSKTEKEELGTHDDAEATDNAQHHEMTNRMHSAETRKRSAKPPSTVTQKQKHESQVDAHAKKAHNEESSLHRYAIEHHVDKKEIDDQKGIPMEQEHLIHVTPVPPKTKSVQKPKTGEKNKTQKNRHSTANQTGTKNQTKPAKGGRKVPKKFNKKLHSLKKTLKKDKSEKQNMKRAKRVKKVKKQKE